MIVCKKCGVPVFDETTEDPDDFDLSECYHCGSKQGLIPQEERAVLSAAKYAKLNPPGNPLPEGFGINVIGDEIHGAAHDWTTGQTYTSKCTRDKDYKAAGMNMYGADEFRRKRGSPMPKPGVGISYAGQKNHKSSAERGIVRTASGTRVI